WDGLFVRVSVFFFFQAEDGIRDFHVTGVQTCALPIFPPPAPGSLRIHVDGKQWWWDVRYEVRSGDTSSIVLANELRVPLDEPVRSEERRVGKESRLKCGYSHEDNKISKMYS